MAKKAKRTKARRSPARKAATRKVAPIPKGYHTVTPYLTVNEGGAALDFYVRAFGATSVMRMPGPGGKVMHAEFRIGDSVVMLADEMPGMSSTKAPTSLGATTGSIFLYVSDVDRAYARAMGAGCKTLMSPTDMFWGDRFAKLEDPFGNQWSMATHKEDVSPAEMKKRMAQMGQAS